MLSTDKNLGYLFGVSVDKCYPDFTFNDGDTLDIAGVKLSVMVTPGHTNGSACFVTENAVFTGDTLFYLSIGRTDLGGNDKQMAESLSRLKNLNGEWVLYCGHGRATTLDYEKKYNPYL
jgi:glyoxylase-like metal-dependent hydrolase (beta-lactamase superfamily II)